MADSARANAVPPDDNTGEDRNPGGGAAPADDGTPEGTDPAEGRNAGVERNPGGGGEGAAQDGDTGNGAKGPAQDGNGGLSDRDRAVLAMARRSWGRPGARERAIREQLGISPTRYYQILNALLDSPEALAHDPVTVNRLRRAREARRNRR